MKYGLEKLSSHTFDKRSLLLLRNIQFLYKSSENSLSTNGVETLYSNKEQNVKTNSETIINLDRKMFLKETLLKCAAPLKKNPSPKKIVIDFSSPNIAKPFHAGHLRSTIIGNFIANAYKYFNNDVIKLNYLGDWGTQFGLLQYGLQDKNIDISKLQDNPMKTLYDVYVYANSQAKVDETVLTKARKYFSDIEQGKTSLENWKTIRNTTIQELQKVYQRLGISFDSFDWESDYNGGAIKHLMNSLQLNDIIKQDESGKKLVTVNDRDVTVLKSDNSTLYLSRDIAALVDRYKRFQFDKMLYVVDNAQTDHFATLFNVVNRIDTKFSIGCEHIKFGRIKGMSTRQGNAVFLNDILDEAKRKMHEKQSLSKNTRSSATNDETCDILGTTAVIINDLKQNRLKDYAFDWDKVLQSEGDSGIKLQYLHCRLWSLEKNSGASFPDKCDPSYLTEEVIDTVVAELAKFEYILQRSLDAYEACILVGYLFRLARHINRMFNELKVKNVDPNLASQRLLVFHSARLVVKSALEILGIKVLHEMSFKASANQYGRRKVSGSIGDLFLRIFPRIYVKISLENLREKIRDVWWPWDLGLLRIRRKSAEHSLLDRSSTL